MPRIPTPKSHEPIRLMEMKSGARYRVVLDVAPPGSPRKQVTRTFGTLRDARKFVVKTRAGLAAGTFVPPTAETVQQLCERWLDSRRDIRPVTRDGYRNWLAPVIRRIGTTKVQALSVADVERLTSWLVSEGGKRGQGLGATSVKASLTALGQALDLAAREGTVNTNVAKLARRPRSKSRRGKDLQHWEVEQLLRFREVSDLDPLAAAWRLTLSGMTRADVLGLRWTDVNFEAGVVTVSQGRVALDHSDHVDDPKSAERRREIPVESMWPGTVERLRSLRARQAADRLRLGPGHADGGLVVIDALGQPVRPEWYSDRFRSLCGNAGVPRITLHAVRHSLAFSLHRQGVPPADAAALLGHTVEVHLSTYLPQSGGSGIAAAAQAFARATVGRA